MPNLMIMILGLIIFGMANLTSINFVSAQSDLADSGDTGGANWWSKAQQGGLEQVGQAYGTSQPKDARMIVVDIIKIVLGFLGLISVVLILYAGFKWMTSGGNEETVSGAKKMLIAGVIGLVIILSAYIIANFVISQIYGATTGAPEI